LKLRALRAELKTGIDALERGDFIEIDEADLEDYLEDLREPLGSLACRPCSPD
jgi:antitoxin ParD1/3/4